MKASRSSPEAARSEELERVRGEVRGLSKRLGGGAAERGRDALVRLSRTESGYAALGGEAHRGDLCPARVEDVALPATHHAFDLREVAPELEHWRSWMLREPPPVAAADTVRSYADPSLRGRKAGRGDGLERLAVRMYEAGMLVPVRRAPDTEGVKLFTVVKNGNEQRLVWDMRAANRRFRVPDKFTQGSVGALAELEVGDPGYLCAAATDVPNFFYALKMPEGFAEYIYLEGLDLNYTKRLLEARGHDLSGWAKGVDALGCERLPMGFSWAPLLAQRCLDSFVAEAPFAERSVQVVHKGGPKFMRGLQSCASMGYLDDFTGLVKRAERDLAAQNAQGMLDELAAVLQRRGLGHHKDQVSEHITTLGVELVCDNTARPQKAYLYPKAEKFAVLLEATRYVAQRGRVKRKALERLVGHWAWWLQLNRPLYSILQSTFSCLLEAEDGWVTLPEATRRELRYLVALAPFIRTELTLPVSRTVHMVDAGPKFGAVIHAQHPTRPEFTDDISLGEMPRHQWKVSFRRSWFRQEHNNYGEGRSVVWATERCARSGIRDHRVVIYSDSRVVIGAFSKGRSSSRTLNSICRKQCAVQLLYGLRVYLRWVASEDNWADGPSRGLPYPCVAPETARKAGAGRACAV